MTREEEFRQAVSDYLKECFALKFPTVNERLKESDLYGAFKHGVKWADNNPRKGLVDIDKVVEWLRNNLEHYMYNYGINEVIIGFTKAMEE